jgi:superfamily II DNA or RNA helicase
MLKIAEWSEDRAYRSGSENEPVQFYMDGLCNSQKFDLLLGYFSSAAINVLSLGFATFLYSGGTVRLVINNILSQVDRDAIKAGREGEIIENAIDLTDIKKLRRTLDEYGKHFFECLAWLIGNEKIQIQIIRPKTGKGIAHYKSGVFSDGINSVGFKASCNFTAYGLLENLEELDAFLSWENARSSKMINRQNNDFEKIFSGNADFVDYLEVEDVAVAIRKEFGSKSLNELVIQERDLIEKKSKVLENRGIRKTFEKIMTRIEEIVRGPKFPYLSGPRDYQIEAYDNWGKNNFHGIFAMATGTGKTITALNCVLKEYNKTTTYRTVIVVPTNVLVDQWEKEAKQFNFYEVIKVSSKYPGWQSEIDRITTEISFGLQSNFLVIITYASFSKPKFQEYFMKFPLDTIFIADEAHNIGSPNILKLLATVKLTKRIGLSATPKRIYDPEGSIKMEEFFNDKEPYIYSFPMEKAIKEGILCQYYYFPKVVDLLPDELEEYSKITKQLVRYFSMGNLENNERVQQLLMERKRIIHKASNKLLIFKNILDDIIKRKKHLEYTLIYAPEGYFSDTNYYDEEEFSDLGEENRIIDYYSSIVRKKSPATTITQYTSESENKPETLKQFEKGDINVLLSMKCLDEGVDIPRTEQAVFCSSTGNPRQFIQRRGRILRKHHQKKFAYIYDMIVLPKQTWSSSDFALEQSLVKKELERVVHFAYMALNKYEAIENIREICDFYQINLDTIHLELAS